MRDRWTKFCETHMNIREEAREEKKKFFQLERQVNELEIEKIQLDLLVESTLGYRSHSPHHNIILQEKIIMYWRKDIMTSNPFEITSSTTLFEAYYACTKEEKNLFYEIYQHNALLIHGPIWKPNHFVGNVQLRIFVSYLNNHVN